MLLCAGLFLGHSDFLSLCQDNIFNGWSRDISREEEPGSESQPEDGVSQAVIRVLYTRAEEEDPADGPGENIKGD